MANYFKVNVLVLDKQDLTATGSNLYLNGLLIGSGIYASLDSLVNSGIQIETQINSLSGWSAPALSDYVYKSGNQPIAGVKSFNDSTLFYNNLRFNVNNVTGNFNFNSGFYRYVWTGNYQWTGILPDYITYSGFEFMIKHGGTTGVILSISGLIDYNINTVIIPYQSLNIWSNGESWILN